MSAVVEPSARKPGRPKNPDLEARRKAEILDVAALVFARDGFADTDVQVIAKQVGVSKGTIYHYFQTKDNLFLEAVDRGLQELSAECDAVMLDPARSPLDRVEAAVLAYLAFFHRRPEMAELFIQERAAFRDRRTPLYFTANGDCVERDVEFVKALTAAGLIRETDPRRAIEVVSDLLFGTILSNHLASRRVRPQDQAKAILDIIMNGLLSETERKRRMASKPLGSRVGSRIVKSIALFLSAILGTSGCLPKETASTKKQEAEVVPVTAQAIQRRDIQRTISSVGTLNGWDEVQIAPKVDGRIANIRVDVGDRVLPGSVLLEIDPIDARLAVQEGRRAFETELARIGLSEIPKGVFRTDLVPVVRAATVAVDDAARRLKQKKDLLVRGAGSPDDVEIAQTDFNLAEARKSQAITEAESTLASAKWRKAQLEMAEQRLRDCQVEAPLPDRFYPWAAAVGPAFVPVKYAVSGRMASEGEMIRSTPVTNVFKLVLDFSLKLKLQVPEQASNGVRIGQIVEIRVDAFPQRLFQGQVARINPAVDPSNRTFMVEVEVPNAAGALKVGGFAKATLLSKTDRGVATVPHEAIVSFAGVTKIFIISGQEAKSIEVRTGTREKDWVEIIGDFPADAKVITSGLSQIVDGTPVRIR